MIDSEIGECSFDIRVVQYKTLKNVVWKDIPPLAVLTGRNGSGKTMFLDAVAANLGCLPPPSRRMPPEPNIVPHQVQLSFVPLGRYVSRQSRWEPVSAHAQSDSVGMLLDYVGTEPPEIVTQIRARDPVRSTQLAEMRPDEYRQLVATIGDRMSFAAVCWLYRYLEMWARINKTNVSALGSAPWAFANGLLEGAGVSVRVVGPRTFKLSEAESKWPLSLQACDPDGRNVRGFGELSAGETTIVEFATWFTVASMGRPPALLLLDEPDAHLHPALTRQFFSLLESIVAMGTRVIASTHSATTVALAPPGSVYEIRRGVAEIRRAEPLDAIIGDLTEGLVVVEPSSSLVFVEGITDAPFYRQMWELALLGNNGIPIVDRTPQPAFLHLKTGEPSGKTFVRSTVRLLRSQGLHRFSGIVDRDDGTDEPVEGVFPIGRHSLENYVYDPLNVWLTCVLQLRGTAQQNLERFAQLVPYPVDLYRHQSGVLQEIADWVFARLEPHIPDGSTKSDRVPVSFVSGQRIEYPRWFVESHGKDVIVPAVEKAIVSRAIVRPEDFLRHTHTLRLIPNEIAEIFRAIQRESRGA